MEKILLSKVLKWTLLIFLFTIGSKVYSTNLNKSDSITVHIEELKLASKAIVERNYYKDIAKYKDGIIQTRNSEISLLNLKVSKYTIANDELNRQLYLEKVQKDKFKKQRNTFATTTAISILTIILSLCLK